MSVSRSRGRRRILTSVIAIGAAAVLLGGCARAGVASTSDADKATGKGLVIGWTQRSIAGSDWYKTLVAGGQAEAKKLGAKLVLLDANGDTVQQNSDVQTIIAKGADVVVMNANDPIGVGPSLLALKKDKIPVVAVNSNLSASNAKNTFCYIAENQTATGALAGKVIAEKAIAKYGDSGTYKLLAIGGFPGDVISELRYKGFMKGYDAVMKDHPNVKTVALPLKYGSWKPDQALAPIRDAATANPDIKIVFSMSDVMQGGIESGLKQAGIWNDVLEGSYDGQMSTVREMEDDPTGPIQADASNGPYEQGQAAVRMAVDAYAGKTSACPSGTQYIDTTVVTPDNAKQYYDPSLTHVRVTTQK
ncbi:sugar ABC transporter substrate-binding protein [Curtobacterium sp. RRHDQ10]|uniref:sugar ABC transporter substrate-binding protein n=1 Tax=Curtobacterium phyllosphaerae TaxID=3413379 RepID=UPI003BF21789